MGGRRYRGFANPHRPFLPSDEDCDRARRYRCIWVSGFLPGGIGERPISHAPLADSAPSNRSGCVCLSFAVAQSLDLGDLTSPKKYLNIQCHLHTASPHFPKKNKNPHVSGIAYVTYSRYKSSWVGILRRSRNFWRFTTNGRDRFHIRSIDASSIPERDAAIGAGGWGGVCAGAFASDT